MVAIGIGQRANPQKTIRPITCDFAKAFRAWAERCITCRSITWPLCIICSEQSMNRPRFEEISARYRGLKIALVGDFCLDRYLEIDPSRQEISIETGLPVHNVVRVRAQPGAAGTILNNLAALRIGEIYPIGFAGDD